MKIYELLTLTVKKTNLSMNFKAYYASRQSMCTDLHVTKILQIAISKNIKGPEAVSICES